jgi:predicted phage gp36 major capsid-like protein
MKEVIEKLDAIEAANVAKVEEIKGEVAKSLEEVKTQVTEQVAALEAKVAAIQAPAVVKIAKSVREDVNRSVKEQLRDFYKSSRSLEKEIKMFADESQYDAFLKESSTLTGSGAGIGGRTAYDPVFVPLRLANPMRGVSRNVSTEGATYQFRAKVGNAGPAWGYTIQNNGAATTEATNIWQLTLQDLNVQFPIRTAALDDIDGLESNVVSDMLVEFSQAEALSMIKNDDQDAGAAYGGTNGLRGLNQYGGAAATYSPGEITVADFGTSGTGSSSGLHDIATYDQLTTNAAGSANNVNYKDLINFIYDLPQQYWTPGCKFVINPLMLAGIRGLVDDNGTPVFERMSPLETDGIVGRLLGFDVVVNKYLDNPTAPDASPGTTSLYPMYFGDWSRGHTIVDRLNMVLRRYDQTLPGFITFYGEKRLCTSVVDPFSIIRYRSTATGA